MRKRTTYGKKGGTGANAGKKASTYEFTMPDGTVKRKKSFSVHTKAAQVGIYQHRGVWYVAGVWALDVDVTQFRQTAVEARKV